MDRYATYDAMKRTQQGCVHGLPRSSGRSGNALATLLAQARRNAAAQATDPRPAGTGEGSGRSGNALATLLAQARRPAVAQATDPGPAGAGEGSPPSCSGQGQGRVHGSPRMSDALTLAA